VNSDNPSLFATPEGYGDWLATLKARIHAARQRTAFAANRELVSLSRIGLALLGDWSRYSGASGAIGLGGQDHRAPGTRPENRVSRDERTLARQPALHACLRRGLPDETIVQQLVGLLPWGHNLMLISKLKD